MPKTIGSGSIAWNTDRNPCVFSAKAKASNGSEKFRIRGKWHFEIDTFSFELLHQTRHLRRMDKGLDAHRNPGYCGDKLPESVGTCHLHLYNERPPHHKCAINMPQLADIDENEALILFLSLCNVGIVAIISQPELRW